MDHKRTYKKKRIVAIPPYIHKEGSNFKVNPYNAWLNIGGEWANSHYLPDSINGIAYRFNFPTLWKSGNIAQLRFAEATSLNFDTFPGYLFFEIVPIIWDCWPMYFERTCRWLEQHKVRTAIFTSSQTADRMRQRFPNMNILHITEGIITDVFDEGVDLPKRKVSLFEMGSVKRGYFRKKYPEQYKEMHNKPKDWGNKGQDDLRRLLQNSKLTVIFPRSITEPEIAQGIETLTLRYWECMLSRILMVGHAPKELTDLIEYNPVIELDMEHDLEQIEHILADIENPIYQQLVDRNRETALQLGSWEIRMKQVMDWLSDLGYKVK